MLSILPKLRQVGLRPVTPNGVLGDPTCADAARGECYLDTRAAEIAAQLKSEP